MKPLMTFGRRNLLEPITDLGPFDVIFCRNVAIYFDAQTRRDLFLRLADRLTPEGCLFVGSSECLVDLGPRFIPRHHCHGTYYQPSMPPAPSSQPVSAGTPAADPRRQLDCVGARP
jgi:chemotaxis protein methyltransferase CheR